MRKSLLLTVLAAVTLAAPSFAASITYPDAPGPDPDHVIIPPHENQYFYMRPDGQPEMLQTDSTINWTQTMNRHYYDFNWRGEVWSPFDSVTQGEKGMRLMHGWPQYYAATQGRIFTGWHLFWEKWSGFGPQ